MFKKNSHPCHGDGSKTNQLPEVAEHPQAPQDAAGLADLAAFKVLLKRNLRHEAPPADLLGDIRARIAKIRDAD